VDDLLEEVRFARDSPLEGDGFEPSVPRSPGPPCDGRRFRTVGTSADRGFRAVRHGGGASPRTTKLYDRTGDEITLDEVERIRI
jgi:hypothetical protein